MTPPTLVSETDAWTKLLVKEMIAHKDEFERVRDTKEKYNELDTFWLRKSKQPVLSVLMVKKKNKAPKFFRGINVEVSMPTGSLCSERNAIGSALSSDPSLCRKDLRMIAVLALGLEAHATTSTLSAHMPIPSAIIPLGHTPTSVGGSSCYNNSASPIKVPMSPRNFPKVVAFATSTGEGQASSTHQYHLASSAHNDDSFGQDDAMDESSSDTLPPLAASSAGGRSGLLRAASERSILSRKNSNAGTAVPTSPSIKGRQNSTTSAGVPSSPRASLLSVSKASGEEDALSTTATPRKRKATEQSPAVSAINSPMLLSPRLTRAGSMRDTSPQPASSSHQMHSPRAAFGKDLSTLGGFSLENPATAAAAASSSSSSAMQLDFTPSHSTATTPLREGLPSSDGGAGGGAGGGRKRVKRTNSSSSAAPATGSEAPQSSSPEPGFGLAHLHGGAAQEVYLRHELDLVRHREALMLPPSVTAQLSGNTAPNAVTPMDRCQSEEIRAHRAGGGAHVTDERNPINPCGSCNEWLKKVAEVNPDFKVVTFTSTDCSTCFVKAVKF
jgi:cytidine deaminase